MFSQSALFFVNVSISKLLVREQADKKAAVEAQARVEKEANDLRARCSSAKVEAESQQKVTLAALVLLFCC